MCARRLRKVIQYAYYLPTNERTYMVDELQDNPGFYGIVWYDEDGKQHPVRRKYNPLPDRRKVKTAEKDLREMMTRLNNSSGNFSDKSYVKATERRVTEEIDEPDSTIITTDTTKK